MATLVERLWRARAGGETDPIENFERYTAAVVFSACAHQIRRQHPERARLKNRLRYVFSTDRRLALWMSDDDLVCGPGVGGAPWLVVSARPAGTRAVVAPLAIALPALPTACTIPGRSTQPCPAL